MSQYQQKLQKCNRCKDAGFPGQMIGFEKNGTKEDGSVKWKVVDRDMALALETK